ncbi:MAG: 2OG-Fe(II) oxygenase [Acidobacteria bacterium]|nr:2OG-Fe(II) oxygenase [Acidobacteriota bacterium]
MEIADGIYTFRDVYTAGECQEFINLSEGLGFEAAPINMFGGAVLRPDVRNNARVILDDEPLAEGIWARVKQHLPRVLNGRRAIGLNERLRFYRYDPGEKFEPHVDGYYMRPNGEQSLLTFMLYLNGGFEGGETNFQSGLSVKPEPGMLLVFRHALYHEGAAVVAGRKYVLRSDVMFSL